MAELETAMREQIAKFKREGISEEELERVKAQVIAAEVYQRDSLFYQAMQIGELETAGLPLKAGGRVEKLKAVTADRCRPRHAMAAGRPADRGGTRPATAERAAHETCAGVRHVN